jgi:large conductance mechanosensitive channel
MSLLQEFKTFAMRGNVIDLAVGVVIGTAFGKIVSGLVDKVVMPVLGILTGGIDFSDMKYVLKPEIAGVQPEVAIGYGAFLQTIIDFTIIAFAIFMMVRLLNKAFPKPKENPKALAGPSEAELLAEIRDLLKKQGAKK